MDLHDITILQRHSLSETESVSSEKVDMQVARSPVRFVLEMMVFEVGETVRHCLISAENRARPFGFACAFNGYLSGQRIELRIRYKLGTDRTVPQLRCGEIEVVSLLEAMIRELVAGCHPKPARHTRSVDKVDACNLRLLSTVLGVGRDDQRLEMAAQDTADPL